MLQKVSVIIPTHNRAQFIGVALESVLNQTWNNFEIIIIDDGSIDNTKDVIDSYNLEFVTYVYINQGGPGRARNEGIKRAKGDIIAFLDSDDVWDSKKIELQMELLSRNSQIHAVLSNLKFIDNQGIPFNESVVNKDYVYRGEFLSDYLDGRLPVYTSALIVRREVFDKIGLFDEKHMIAEDMDLWIKLATHFKLEYLHLPLTHIRKHPGNITSSRGKTYLAATVMIERNYENLKSAGLSPEKYIARFFNLAGNEAIKGKNRSDAIINFKKAIKSYPRDIGGYSGIIKTFMIPIE